jgi:hypothetical protein
VRGGGNRNSFAKLISREFPCPWLNTTTNDVCIVPPTIEDSASSSDVIVREGSDLSLTCQARGSPTPSVKWRREDGRKISTNKSFSSEYFSFYSLYPIWCECVHNRREREFMVRPMSIWQVELMFIKIMTQLWTYRQVKLCCLDICTWH